MQTLAKLYSQDGKLLCDDVQLQIIPLHMDWRGFVVIPIHLIGEVFGKTTIIEVPDGKRADIVVTSTPMSSETLEFVRCPFEGSGDPPY